MKRDFLGLLNAGAGKSTLLDVLSMRDMAGKVEAGVSTNISSSLHTSIGCALTSKYIYIYLYI